MDAPAMHEGEASVDVGLVSRLLRAQAPHLADLPVRPGPTTGTVNRIFRLGEDLCVRLPRLAGGAASLEKEVRWLPRLAPQLPFEVPEPVVVGDPGPQYPFTWAVYRWVTGQAMTAERPLDQEELARGLAGLVSAFRVVDPTDGPPSGRLPLGRLDESTRTAIAAADGIDHVAVTAAWERALDAPVWDGRPVWRHGDLLPPNLVMRDGRLAAVLDFGGCGIGDPAIDLIPAWTILGPVGRSVFRSMLGPDDGTWERARGVALHQALLIIPDYRTTNPCFADLAFRTVREIASDHTL
jgi:aminoglycoside phosphotransferase (APT) family kinase protein